MELTKQQEEQLNQVIRKWLESQGISPYGWIIKIRRDGRGRPHRATKIELSEQDWQVILALPWKKEGALEKLKMLKARGNDGFVPSDFEGPHVGASDFAQYLSNAFRKAGLDYRCTCALGGTCWEGPFKIRICKAY
ncbi:MAG: hypothetical protein ABSA74_01160 [Candidatus Staskawiczbacteria bacterium]|jgi:hypothetical protein